VAVLVVDSLEAVHVDVRHDHGLAGSPRAVDLALELLQADATASGAGQLVGPGVLAILPGFLAIARTELAVTRGLPAVMRRAFAITRRALAALNSSRPQLLQPHRVPVQQCVGVVEIERSLVGELGVTVAPGRELVACSCRSVALLPRTQCKVRQARVQG